MTVYLTLGSAEPQGSAKGCRGFRRTHMSNGGNVLLAVINLQVRIKIRVETYDANHSVIESIQ